MSRLEDFLTPNFAVSTNGFWDELGRQECDNMWRQDSRGAEERGAINASACWEGKRDEIIYVHQRNN